MIICLAVATAGAQQSGDDLTRDGPAGILPVQVRLVDEEAPSGLQLVVLDDTRKQEGSYEYERVMLDLATIEDFQAKPLLGRWGRPATAVWRDYELTELLRKLNSGNGDAAVNEIYERLDWAKADEDGGPVPLPWQDIIIALLKQLGSTWAVVDFPARSEEVRVTLTGWPPVKGETLRQSEQRVIQEVVQTGCGVQGTVSLGDPDNPAEGVEVYLVPAASVPGLGCLGKRPDDQKPNPRGGAVVLTGDGSGRTSPGDVGKLENAAGVRTVLTNWDGHFEFDGVADGEYVLVAKSPAKSNYFSLLYPDNRCLNPKDKDWESIDIQSNVRNRRLVSRHDAPLTLQPVVDEKVAHMVEQAPGVTGILGKILAKFLLFPGAADFAEHLAMDTGYLAGEGGAKGAYYGLRIPVGKSKVDYGPRGAARSSMKLAVMRANNGSRYVCYTKLTLLAAVPEATLQFAGRKHESRFGVALGVVPAAQDSKVVGPYLTLVPKHSFRLMGAYSVDADDDQHRWFWGATLDASKLLKDLISPD